MRSPALLLALSTALVGAQPWRGHGGGHDSGGGPRDDGHAWDVSGGYPHGGWGGQRHLPGGPPPPPDAAVHNATFAQLLDHDDPAAGTFAQFYYYSTKFWRGPGSPVILFTPGEVNATLYTTYLDVNRTTGLLAERIGAATIVLEHRYWGLSSPFDDLTTENLRYLTLENALRDMTNFARNVRLPFAGYAGSNAADVPWVTMGGSYSGALAAWLASVEPGTFWAYHASSAPVQAVSDYYAYFTPVQEGMPQNCSRDVSLVIDHMDAVLTNGTAQEVHDLKAMFRMEAVEHHDDFMAALENAPWLWQGNQFYANSGFFTWCDYVEDSVNKTGAAVAGAGGVGLQTALAGYARWWTTIGLPGFCEAYGYAEFDGTYNTACFDTYNASSPLFTDATLSNVMDRQWVWMTCNEPFGYWQDGAPRDRPSIVSRLVTAAYWIRQCGLYFPDGPHGETYGLRAGRSEADVNAYTGGWGIDNTTRLIYVNGGYDPWREVGVSAELRPGGPLQGTAQVPVEVVPGGFHTSDLITQNGAVNAGVRAVQDRVLDQLAAWVAEYPRRGHWTA